MSKVKTTKQIIKLSSSMRLNQLIKQYGIKEIVNDLFYISEMENDMKIPFNEKEKIVHNLLLRLEPNFEIDYDIKGSCDSKVYVQYWYVDETDDEVTYEYELVNQCSSDEVIISKDEIRKELQNGRNLDDIITEQIESSTY